MKSKVLINSAWIVGGKVSQMLLTLVVGALSARYLGPSNYGLINIGASYTALFTPIISLGLYGIIVNEIVNAPQTDGEILGSAIGMRLISSFLSSICIVAIVIFVNPTHKVLWGVTLLQCTAVIFQWADVFNYWCQARYDSKAAVIIQLTAYVFTAAFKIFLLATQKNVYWFAVSMGLDYFIQAIIFMIYYRKNCFSPLRFNRKKARRLLSQSHHYIYASLAGVIYGQIDRLMLGYQIGDATVGLYTAAATISGMWTFVLSAIIDSVRPMIIETRKTDVQKYKNRIIQLYAIVIYLSLLVSTGMCLISNVAIHILYGDAYMMAQSALCILTWSTCFSFLGVARSIWCVCEQKQKYEKYLSLSGAIINVIFNAVFIPFWGLNGAAIATLITQCMTSIVVPFCIRALRENSILIIKALDIRCLWDEETKSMLKSLVHR